MSITREKAEELLRVRVAGDIAAIKKMITVPLTDGQIVALVSFCYNFNQQVLANSTLRLKVKQARLCGGGQRAGERRSARKVPGLGFREKP